MNRLNSANDKLWLVGICAAVVLLTIVAVMFVA
jgi:hypothetical protein